ncbi:MAG: DUF6367 family protein [Chthoniobacterales bacterium]
MTDEWCIIVELDEKVFRNAGLGLLEESQWKQSKYPDYLVRVDPARPELKLKRHATVAHKKHVAAKNKQVSWSDDAKRHDKKTFDVNFKGMSKAMDIARTALRLPVDTQLEAVSDLENLALLCESAEGRELCEAVGYAHTDVMLRATPRKSAGQKFLDLLD